MVASLVPTYQIKQLRIYGDDVRVLKAHPGPWQVGACLLALLLLSMERCARFDDNGLWVPAPEHQNGRHPARVIVAELGLWCKHAQITSSTENGQDR